MLENLKKEIAELSDRRLKVANTLRGEVIKGFKEFEKIIIENKKAFNPYFLHTICEEGGLPNEVELSIIFEEDEIQIVKRTWDHNSEQWVILPNEGEVNGVEIFYIDEIKNKDLDLLANSLEMAIKRYKNNLKKRIDNNLESIKKIKEWDNE